MSMPRPARCMDTAIGRKGISTISIARDHHGRGAINPGGLE